MIEKIMKLQQMGKQNQFFITIPVEIIKAWHLRKGQSMRIIYDSGRVEMLKAWSKEKYEQFHNNFVSVEDKENLTDFFIPDIDD